MASRPRSNQPTQAQRGYNLKPVRLPLDRKYICPEGDHIMKNPVQTCCGERFCEECAHSMLRQSTSLCRLCEEPMKNSCVYPDVFFKRETLTLEVFCEWKEDGCDWQGVLGDYEGHQLNCLHHLVPCPNACGMMVTMANMERHQDIECSQRLVECSYCHVRVAASMLDTHRNQCQLRTASCRYCSAGPMPMNEFARHVLYVCQNVPVSCPFSNFGCKEKIPRKLLDEHRRTFTPVHLDLTMQAVATQKREAESHRTEVDRLKRELQDLAGQVANTTLRQVENGPETVGRLDPQLLEQGRALTVCDIQTAFLNFQADIVDVKNGVLIWKIGDVGRRRREAISGRTPSLYSAPFYTAQAGYKMRAKIRLNGDGSGSGSCVSLYLVIMRGEYDGILPWPFQRKVTMSLIDQSQPEAFRQNITSTIEPSLRSIAFRRPESRYNQGIGFPEFALLNVLDSPTSEYIRDGSIFIKVKVHEHSLTE